MNKTIGVGTGIIMVNDQGQFLMGKRKNAHREGTWSLVGGAMEFGETFEQCARREAKEETGLELGDIQILAIANHLFPESQKHFVNIYMMARIVGPQEPIVMEPHKIEGWHYFDDWDNLPQPAFVDYATEVDAAKVKEFLAGVKNVVR